MRRIESNSNQNNLACALTKINISTGLSFRYLWVFLTFFYQRWEMETCTWFIYASCCLHLKVLSDRLLPLLIYKHQNSGRNLGIEKKIVEDLWIRPLHLTGTSLYLKVCQRAVFLKWLDWTWYKYYFLKCKRITPFGSRDTSQQTSLCANCTERGQTCGAANVHWNAQLTWFQLSHWLYPSHSWYL